MGRLRQSTLCHSLKSSEFGLYKIAMTNSSRKVFLVLQEEFSKKVIRIFNIDANPNNCITIIAIVGDELSIRRLDIEFVKNADKLEFLEAFKISTSIQFK